VKKHNDISVFQEIHPLFIVFNRYATSVSSRRRKETENGIPQDADK
jgi:hypothetical protein